MSWRVGVIVVPMMWIYFQIKRLSKCALRRVAWVPMIFSPSRLIQWVREVALLHASGRRRQMEEIAGFESTTTIGTGQVRNIGVHGMKAQAAFITRLFPIAA